MLDLITKNNTHIILFIVICSGIFAFIKWLDSRKQTLRNERFKNYIELIGILAGSKNSAGITRCMTEQIAAAWLLLEYNEYYNITLKILDNSDLEKMSDENWKEFVAPQVRYLVTEIGKRIQHKKSIFHQSYRVPRR